MWHLGSFIILKTYENPSRYETPTRSIKLENKEATAILKHLK
jgi:hypothetical protein